MSEQGIFISEESSPRINGNTITDNNFGINCQYGYYTHNNPVMISNMYSGNPNKDIHIYGNISGQVAWLDSGVYRISSLAINEGASLKIEPGIIVTVADGKSILVRGTLEATDVTFTWADGLNPWRGIKFYETSIDSRLENCVISHSSDYVQYIPTGGVILIEGSSPVILGCTLSDCDAITGINIQKAASPVIRKNAISGMSEQAIYVSSDSSPIVSYNTISSNSNGISINYNNSGVYDHNLIYNNSSYGIFYSGGTVISANFNYWGDSTGPHDPSDDRASGGWYNPYGSGDAVSDRIAYQPWSVSQYASCWGPSDADTDRDVDGLDLKALVDDSLGILTPKFASEFGRTGCPE